MYKLASRRGPSIRHTGFLHAAFAVACKVILTHELLPPPIRVRVRVRVRVRILTHELLPPLSNWQALDLHVIQV